jgi:hypothetical protein
MRFEAFSFDSICIDGTTYGYDLVIDRGRIRKRKKKPSKRFRDRFGHTPLSIEEEIPWKCRRLVIGTGTGALPVMEEVNRARPIAGKSSSRYCQPPKLSRSWRSALKAPSTRCAGAIPTRRFT